MRRFRWTSIALAALVAAAFVAPVSAQEVDIKPAAKVKKDKYLITAEEIAERTDLTNAYDAVKLLRPNFLKATRAKGAITSGFKSDAYRPDGVSKPVSMGGSGSSGSSGSTGSTGEPAAGEGAGRPGSDDQGATNPYGASSVSAMTTAVLYIDEVKQPNLDELKNVRAPDVFEIKYMTGNEASGRYGAGHEGGAILLKTKRFGKG